MSSLDQIVEGEGVSAVHFATSFPHRGEFELSPCLYVGTTLGSVLVIVIHLPEGGDTRYTVHFVRSNAPFPPPPFSLPVPLPEGGDNRSAVIASSDAEPPLGCGSMAPAPPIDNLTKIDQLLNFNDIFFIELEYVSCFNNLKLLYLNSRNKTI